MSESVISSAATLASGRSRENVYVFWLWCSLMAADEKSEVKFAICGLIITKMNP